MAGKEELMFFTQKKKLASILSVAGKEEPLVQELLALSDLLRDEALPSLGVRVQVHM
jgi:hypothetical protein